MWLLGKLVRFLERALTVSVGANPHFSLNFCYKNIWNPLGNCKTCYGQNQTSKAVSMWIISQLFSIQKNPKTWKDIGYMPLPQMEILNSKCNSAAVFCPLDLVYLESSLLCSTLRPGNKSISLYIPYRDPKSLLYLLKFFFAKPKNYKRGRKLEVWHFKLYCHW